MSGRNVLVSVVAAVVVALVVFGIALPPATSWAANCGGAKFCACGDKVVADYTLPSDLGPCPANGLRLEAKVVLDGGGRTLSGSGDGTGVRIGQEAAGSEVRNLTVTRFHHGVRLIGARNVKLVGVETARNGDPGPGEGYGIDVSGGASDNVFDRLRVHHNADEGIHFGTDAANNRVTNSEFFDNDRENVYFLSCRGNRLERSKVRGSNAGSASVYIKFASDTVLDGNTIDGGPVHIRGGSRDTRITGNEISGAGLVLQEQDDRRFGRGTPSGTTVRGGTIRAARTCARIDAAIGTRFEDVAMSCPDGIRVAAGSRVTIKPAPAAAKPVVSCDGKGECVDWVGGGPPD